MARLIPAPQHTSTATRARVGIHFHATAAGALMLVLLSLGSVAMRAGSLLQHTFVAWAEARQQRELRQLAQADPRLLADLVALQQHEEPRSQPN